jgi:hypothetical protein
MFLDKLRELRQKKGFIKKGIDAPGPMGVALLLPPEGAP